MLGALLRVRKRTRRLSEPFCIVADGCRPKNRLPGLDSTPAGCCGLAGSYSKFSNNCRLMFAEWQHVTRLTRHRSNSAPRILSHSFRSR